ncbi:MAG: hypothetical protein WDO74_37605 [Pseudomonadota bacterium]
MARSRCSRPGAVLGVIAAFLAWLHSRPVASATTNPAELRPNPDPLGPAPSAGVLPAAVSGSAEPRRSAPEVTRRPGRSATRPTPSAAAPELATVRVLVDGPKNATVKVDGQEIVWFGPPHELSVGPHTFQFVPPKRRVLRCPADHDRQRGQAK